MASYPSWREIQSFPQKNNPCLPPVPRVSMKLSQGYCFWIQILGGIGCLHYLAVQLLLWWAQLCVGISKPLMVNKLHLPLLEVKFIEQLFVDFELTGSKLHVTSPWIPTSQHNHVQCIMDIFMISNIFDDEEITPLNYCCLYVHAYHVSDMASSDDKSAIPTLLTTDPQPLPTKWKYHQQTKPNSCG
eukprot:7416319-Ditylum_brightwellii.AAC.1